MVTAIRVNNIPASFIETPRVAEEWVQGNFLKRIPPEQQKELLAKIRPMPPMEEREEAQVVNTLSAMNWNDPLFQREDWLYIALKMHSQGHLDDGQMGHLFLYASCKKMPDFQCYTPESPITYQDILKKGFSRMEGLNMDQAIEDLRPYPTPADLQVFSYRIARKLIDLAHIKELFSKEGGGPLNETEKNAAFHGYLFNDFKFLPIVEHEKYLEFLIIPPKLFQQLLCNKFLFAMRPSPALGYNPTEELSDPEQRVMSISSPLSLIGMVHNAIVDPNGPAMYLHDMYHLLLESANPHRAAWIELATLFGNRKGTDLAKAQEQFLDRDFGLYLKQLCSEEKQPPSETFFKLLEGRLHNLNCHAGYDMALTYIQENGERWQSQYGLQVPTPK